MQDEVDDEDVDALEMVMQPDEDDDEGVDTPPTPPLGETPALLQSMLELTDDPISVMPLLPPPPVACRL